MKKKLKPGDKFPDFSLPDQNGRSVNLSDFTRQGEADKRYGFKDGYPLIVIFYRGFFCPRDQQQFRSLLAFQKELNVNFCKMVAISADEPIVSSAFKAGLGAGWPFLCDTDRKLIRELDILDETEGEYAYRALPYTFVLKPDLEVFKIYNGWYFVGRPTIEELRIDLRSIMQEMDYYSYEAFNSPHVKKIRIPQQTWTEGYSERAEPTEKGIVDSFNIRTGNGYIKAPQFDELIFFNFTAIPGEGYRTIKAGEKVKFELVKTHTGLSATNILRIPD
ncbi:redoxin domain-containing protein [Leptobacterium flavescens]|uniref:thioredoxin-dependent peroxiredoxin n=1 Tax=Leptobacterium flavescens TaxID=472055 RepID=A0A6P0UGE4_9FLAO|nr:redoxin domain-containing protein [Leptobacterium flavescens]NER12087.1 redoxin domain-containing protein [Leptobacterium flavescens]